MAELLEATSAQIRDIIGLPETAIKLGPIFSVIESGTVLDIGESGDTYITFDSVSTSIIVKKVLDLNTVNKIINVADPTLAQDAATKAFVDAQIATVGGPEFSDALFRINDNVDPTKQIAFQASAITTGTVRTVTAPDADVELVNTLDGLILDVNIAPHVSTKITITAKVQLNGAIVYSDQANVFGDFNQDFKDDRLRIFNATDSFAYTFVAAALAFNVNLNLPLLTVSDNIVTEAFSQPLTNKTINLTNNTLEDIADAQGDLIKHNGTKFVRFGVGTPLQQIRVNAGGTDLEYFTEAAGIGTLRIVRLAGVPISADRTALNFLDTGTIDFTVVDDLPNSESEISATIVGGSIANVEIATHTSTQITIVAKSQLNAQIVYDDVTNTFLTNNWTFGDAIVRFRNPLNTASYVLLTSSITVDRNISLPLLINNDVFVFEAETQVLTNKTLDTAFNTITVVSADVTDLGSSTVTFTNKTIDVDLNTIIQTTPVAGEFLRDNGTRFVPSTIQSADFPAEVVRTDQTNTYGAFAQIYPDIQLQILNPAADAEYHFRSSAIIADRDITLPLLIANDVFVFQDFAQTLTLKTIALGNNTITGTALEFDTAVTDDNFAFVSDNLSVFAATTSAQLAGVISDETGTGLLVFNDTPTLLTPTIADFTNAVHNHENVVGGGTLTVAAISDLATATITFSNKSIALGTNTISGTLAQFQTALTDATFVDLDDAQTLINKTILFDANTLNETGAALGDILKHDATSYRNFAKGTALQFLRVNPAGTDLEYVSGFLAFAKVIKSVDEGLDTTIVLQDDDELFFTPTINTIYFIKLFVFLNSPAAADFKFAFTVPAGATIDIIDGGDWSPTADTDLVNGTVAQVITTSGNDATIAIYGRIIMGATAGNVTFQWAQNNSNAGTTSVLQGSLLEVWEE